MDNSDFLIIHFQRMNHKIPISSILYIESDLRRVLIHTTRSVYQCYQRLGELEERLSEHNFFRCHQSYLVSLDNIDFYTNTRVYLKNSVIPVSKRHQKELTLILTRQGVMRSKPFSLPSTLPDESGQHGTFVCVSGLYHGMVVHLLPDQKILIGRNGTIADIIINLPEISRIHCTIVYKSETGEYEICDQSRNGTFVNGKRLLAEEIYKIPPGSELFLGTKESIFKVL